MSGSTDLARLTIALADRYRVERELGAGGMATVYLAHDLKHERDVAIKVLKPDLSQTLGAERFLREIQLAAKLSHPHILPLFDSGDAGGVLFYVMPRVAGISLRDRLNDAKQLPVDEAVRIATEVAGALDYAHRQGVVHRDIKPENIMLQDGHALVADFGIGKALSAVDGEAFTQVGMSVGTPAYISPEQAVGEAVDGRSDLYSLGCVLYEMLVGEPPFTGPSVQAVIAKRFVQTPADVTALRDGVPRTVSRAVSRALSRSVVDRYESAAAFAKSLGEIEVVLPASAPEKSLAVMPFVNRSGDADNQYFSDGLSEDLINALTAVDGLHVASRTSAFRFRGSELDIRDIGAQLSVASVLEGSVRRSGTKLRVTAQLVSVTSGFQLWSARYDREMTDVFEIQDEIVASIVRALVPALMGEAPKSSRRATENLEAYELYLKGRHLWHQRSPAAVRLAITHFQQAIGLDPAYALPYCGLADCYGILRVYGWTRHADNQAQAAEAVAKAIALAPDMAEANFSKGFFQFYFERDWRTAAPHFARARELAPRNSLIQIYSALFFAIAREHEAVRVHVQLACEADPLSPFVHGLSSCAYFIMGDHVEAERSARRARELQSDHMLGLWTHGLALSALERHEDAIEALSKAIAVSRAPFYLGAFAFALARAGRVDDARGFLGELDERAARGEYVPAFARLHIHVGLDDVAGVRRELALAVEEVTPPFSLWVVTGVFLDAFRRDAEVARLLDAWDQGVKPALA